MFADRVLSGMRPTGRMHIGHYHGALKNWVRLQEEHECLFFAADWHALTTHYEAPEDIAASVWEMFMPLYILCILSSESNTSPFEKYFSRRPRPPGDRDQGGRFHRSPVHGQHP